MKVRLKYGMAGLDLEFPSTPIGQDARWAIVPDGPMVILQAA